MYNFRWLEGHINTAGVSHLRFSCQDLMTADKTMRAQSSRWNRKGGGSQSLRGNRLSQRHAEESQTQALPEKRPRERWFCSTRPTSLLVIEICHFGGTEKLLATEAPSHGPVNQSIDAWLKMTPKVWLQCGIAEADRYNTTLVKINFKNQYVG